MDEKTKKMIDPDEIDEMEEEQVPEPEAEELEETAFTEESEVVDLPMIPLRGLSVFPNMVLHFDIGREKSINALEKAMIMDQHIFLASQKDDETDLPTPDDFYHIGTIGKIKQMLKLPGDSIRVLVEDVLFEVPYFRCRVRKIEDEPVKEDDAEAEALMRTVLTSFDDYISINQSLAPEVFATVVSINEPGRMADMIASHLECKLEDKQTLLEILDPKERLEKLNTILLKEIEILNIEQDINSKVKSQINQNQREYYLREQMRAIQDELGVTERVLEYLAVVQLSKGLKGPILCLVGPPGVGKTSIAKSVARSINREFVRMSLGGVRDEAEIRGHRRTYIGAIPGRIMNAIKECGTKNPVFLFDEVDKIGADYKGDPASALLEVLDPEQNKDFTDHYLEVPFDLSKVMFITTANSTDTIPRPLLDRMEVIEVSGYTEEEKLNIAEKYLVPKQIKENGLSGSNISFTEQGLRTIINYYTRESGVRNLEREIGNLCRKVAKSYVCGDKKKVSMSGKKVQELLGKKKFHFDIIKGETEVGVTTGLAWTAVGGDTLFIETVAVPGTGKLVLTGQLGDVMQESAKAGISYIRSAAHELKIDEEFYKKCDLHIHIPEGAIPKDGPSAGVTMCTAIISTLTGIPVRKDVAMTGEITLRGKVLPVGGIREKVLAAHRAGIRKVLLPKDNEPDIQDIPEAVRDEMEFVLIKHVKDALKQVLVKDKKNEHK